MVTIRHLLQFLILLAAWGQSTSAQALLQQTSSDLAVLEDALRYEIEIRPALKSTALPALLAPPLHHWQESRTDFAPSVTKLLKTVFDQPNVVVDCQDCDAWRMHVRRGGSTMIHNGALSLEELALVKRDPRYATAKSVIYTEETPSGVAMRIINIADGSIIFQTLASAGESLEDVRPYLHLTAEKQRRLRGESLFYSFVNFGIYPTGMLQFEFIEQWGSHNQHLSGIGISLFNPIFALGGVYHYLLRSNRRIHITGSVYYPIASALQSSISTNDSSTGSFVIQGGAQYTFQSSFGVFAALSTEGAITLGFNLYNPLLMPFLL